jgi:O-antigen ligase
VRLVRGRADARWFPSRHNFALFRLIAYLRLRRAQPEHRNVILIIDRHQSAGETWLVMSWVTLTLACYLATTLFADWHIALALLASLPLAIVLLEVPAILSALTIAPALRVVTRGRANGIATNSVVMMLLFTAASAYFARHPTWIRFVAWQFLALLALNAVAAMIAFSLRNSIARLEHDFGGVTSAR